MPRLMILAFSFAILALAGMLLAPTSQAVAPGTSPFERTWSRTDQPIQDGSVARTWMWGPSAFTSAVYEPYIEAPGERRVVQYYDKARMEITDPSGDPNSIWYVTNGLLVVELITGQLQFGDNEFAELTPATINVAGDADDPEGPTYATFTNLLDALPASVGTVYTQRLTRDGSVIDDPNLATRDTRAALIDEVTNHAIAEPFWNFMNATGTVYENGRYVPDDLFENPYFATGRPITEAYWATVRVAATPRDVLMQCFERRCLTYTPDNPEGWQVEAGNVDQHYYRWRYLTNLPTEPPELVGEHDPIGSHWLTDWPVNQQGQSTLQIANQSPYPMEFRIDGPTSRTLTLPACEDCVVYSSAAQVPSCREDIHWEEFMIPSGNYRVEVHWPPEADAPPLGGPWTALPDAIHGTCFFIIEEP